MLKTRPYLTFVRAGLADSLTALTLDLCSKPAPTVRAGLAEKLTTTTRNFCSKPAPTYF
ncbi:hypothetical protein H6G17_05500 [Chroococcidiopsis sp. FACHB-1243]|uniref:hypothetical protein n=1 Tax=Chroococcidiopsis sp. [FACHB-1243] TaxID=2692781 RepID=UPI00177F4377|nr:hypothetical protein [Chroococcidiopsis sp. [FACHB-1243]]MBD2304969.1 hypothetical protein [Chroococcidiopsis sp. [FACHB-1243]]